MATVLERIKAYKLEEIAARKSAHPFSAVEADAKTADPVRPFGAALTTHAQDAFGLIAEVKKASPSKGLIREDFDPSSIAAAYEAGGAACLSVLTDAPSFQGHEDYLRAARSACTLPVLRKDFLYDPWQVAETRALSADCILIIMASVDDTLAAELEDAATHWGMDALIEVHDAEELDRAHRLRSPLIGINNRNLHDFSTSLDITRTLAKRVESGRVVVSESGLFTPDDLAAMADHGVRRFLIGESLMRQDDVAAATRAILGHAA
ncbi:Indole-3-glycerol phosphate synthase [Rhodobacteraceae bacterium THAF1]|uniref:indole-3-glycerol phosphate synthase TrpC n=1 Tax=Palleronia sp. THAF1 TaxID=2587842 RepID=UPI000F4040D3|nr:indole-3-glycerol phosphate synthase TrpC [Palleronia sp. THAF1]QFU08236.1 Indole-3-glycerol phosphate synthase [Palleronia sp. THAF1]VDC28792.1 Indole-3-glycerol phosphate synthase [Rhodobacteraceae bacterium THAF1]